MTLLANHTLMPVAGLTRTSWRFTYSGQCTTHRWWARSMTTKVIMTNHGKLCVVAPHYDPLGQPYTYVRALLPCLVAGLTWTSWRFTYSGQCTTHRWRDRYMTTKSNHTPHGKLLVVVPHLLYMTLLANHKFTPCGKFNLNFMRFLHTVASLQLAGEERGLLPFQKSHTPWKASCSSSTAWPSWPTIHLCLWQA